MQDRHAGLRVDVGEEYLNEMDDDFGRDVHSRDLRDRGSKSRTGGTGRCGIDFARSDGVGADVRMVNLRLLDWDFGFLDRSPLAIFCSFLKQ